MTTDITSNPLLRTEVLIRSQQHPVYETRHNIGFGMCDYIMIYQFPKVEHVCFAKCTTIQQAANEVDKRSIMH